MVSLSSDNVGRRRYIVPRLLPQSIVRASCRVFPEWVKNLGLGVSDWELGLLPSLRGTILIMDITVPSKVHETGNG